MTLRRYEQVRKRKGSAIAKTIDGTCLACHMRLPPMLFQKLLRGEVFEQCPSCARILYYEAPTAPPAGAS
jgi:predicted  nucleic acid-binding Zn-ribbon protein